jgi:hypothetical protein
MLKVLPRSLKIRRRKVLSGQPIFWPIFAWNLGSKESNLYTDV